jgi:acylphosphatase
MAGLDPAAASHDGDRERLDVLVRGRVQGVGFRVFVAREAWRLGLGGWVRNEADGAVHVVAQGPSADLDALLAILHEGPYGAEVRDVRVSRGPAVGSLSTFEIRAGSHGGD